MSEFRIYHVARNVAKHNYELDDRWYGSPLEKETVDWTLENPQLYLQRLKNELSKINMVLDDLLYLMQEKGYEHHKIPEEKKFSLEEANAHVFHKFNTRQFEYAEKLSHQLKTKTPEEIRLLKPKADRQLNVLLAAREDLTVTIVRFTEYKMQIEN